ncbi:glucuronate isomerase [Paenibacillus sp. FSL H8-0548]|uniref:glucuronate isomerase n=1 Tax=Paenibacillus sp. FSL H8-0548 TaxID=1920422 RepID=UPI00096D220B|nr:glucuronate isomerase [Paenibacillus sp. FSL H8-0548]OMF38648.1 glucuronate isomerase [Paenibacillus sp. FSL H8-0548]
MKPFMDDNFLLSSETAVRLYHDFAKDMPIIDYHCHLSPQQIFENTSFNNLTEAWLYGDHYKWRALRANGVEERYITGGEGVSDYERFVEWAKTVPQTIGNPLYQWSHLELRRYFGVYELINEKNAPAIWEQVNAKLVSGQFKARDLIKMSNVEVICTTDDPVDSLEYHIAIKELKDFNVQVLPSFRPDKALEINRSTFLEWVSKLGAAASSEINSYDALLDALAARVKFFDEVGCKVSDHALDYVAYAETTKADAAAIFAKALNGETVTLEEEKQYKTYTLLFLGRLYAERGWAMQFHINAARNNSSRMFDKLGPDTGFDSINDSAVAYPLAKLLDALDSDDALPKTIVYSLNAKDNDVLGSIIGSFQGGGVPGKIQLGSAWWFNDTKNGMLDQMNALANLGLLSRFVGMLTDSRSFLSYTRHEYFRRLLCNLLGEWVENGEAPQDMELLGDMVQNISYRNAKAYFGF